DAMAIGMNDDIYEVGIIKGRSREVERLVGEVPGRRPCLPQKSAQRPPVHLEAGTAAFCVEVILIPNRAFCRRTGRSRRRDSVLNGVPTDQYRCLDSIRI